MAWYNPATWLDNTTDQFITDETGKVIPNPDYQNDAKQSLQQPQGQPTQEQINAANTQQPAMPDPQAKGSLSNKDYEAISQRSANFPGMMQRGRDVASMRQGLEDYLQQPAQVNLSPLAGLVDTWTGSNLAKSYVHPPSAEERQMMIEKLQSGINKASSGLTEDQAKFFKSQLEAQANNINADNTQQRIDNARADASRKAAGTWSAVPRAVGPNGFAVSRNSVTGETREDIGVHPLQAAAHAGDKQASQDLKRLDAFHDDMDPTMSRKHKNISDLDKKIKNIQGIEEQVAQAGGPDNMTPDQIASFSEEVASVLGAGGATSEARLHALTPNFAGKGMAQWKQYITGEAQSAGGGDLIKVLLNEVQSRKIASQDQIKQHQYFMVNKYKDLAAHKDPYVRQQYKSVMDQYGLDPSKDTSKDGQYVSQLSKLDYEHNKPSNLAPGAEGGSSTAIAAPASNAPVYSDADAVNWARKNINNPKWKSKAQEILDHNAEVINVK